MISMFNTNAYHYLSIDPRHQGKTYNDVNYFPIY